MKAFAMFAPVLLVFGLLSCCAYAQQTAPTEQGVPGQTIDPNKPPTERPTEPGTQGSGIQPASQAPKPVQAPDVRLDSKPHTDIDYTVDSSRAPMDLGLGADPGIDLGHDILPTTPPGMLARAVEDNPRIVYYALPHRTGDGILPADAALLTARQQELVQAASFHGYDLRQMGWQYQQGVCPAAEPNAERAVGVPPADDGVILLHFIRRDKGRDAAFTAVVPRGQGEPVRIIPVAHNSVESGPVLLRSHSAGAATGTALPPSTLYKNLEPTAGWIAASACIAELAGAYPHIPNEPYLSEDIVTAPAPQLRLGLDGGRESIFADRVDETHLIVWDEAISNHGKVLSAGHDVVKLAPRPVTNPPEPHTRMLVDLPEPKGRIMPEPPSPLAGSKQ